MEGFFLSLRLDHHPAIQDLCSVELHFIEWSGMSRLTATPGRKLDILGNTRTNSQQTPAVITQPGILI